MPPLVSDAVEPPRCIATIKLPGPGVPSICAMQCVNAQQNGQQAPSDTPAGNRQSDTSSNSSSTVCVMVATAEGLFYEYHMQDLTNPQGPTCTLEGESYLLAQKR